jgi:uncharacterized protein
MQNFTNDTIDTTRLPKFEEVAFTSLHPSYWKVMMCNIAIVFILLGGILVFGACNITDWQEYQTVIIISYMAFLVLTVVLSWIGFKKRAFAFRTHDVLFRHGIIATKTTVIPYNRVQHVSLHEGAVSRFFGLAKVEIFTAGGSSSDIEIPGIEKQQAENIKQLLMGKIQKQL